MRSPFSPTQPSLAALEPYPPQWVYDAMGAGETLGHERLVRSAGSRLQIATSGSLVRVATSVPDALAMTTNELRDSVSDAYVAIADALDARRSHPIRFWNFVPSPGTLMEPGLDRYMVFNAGRHDAYMRLHGGQNGFGHSLATASAVGIAGRDLVVHCLASDRPGAPVENPRQIPAWRYSERYGPLPPCFARATRAAINGRALLLIGGTASIVGEDSRHARNIEGQLDETFRNLAALIAAARGAAHPDPDELHRVIDARVYVVKADDASFIQFRVGACFTNAASVEFARSDVCRPELLVEIEGVALI